MIKVFIPEIKRRYNKSNVRGLWFNTQKKIEYDYIIVKDYNQTINSTYYYNLFLDYLELIKLSKKQECIFYTIDNCGYVYFSYNHIVKLPYRIYIEVNKADLKNKIRWAWQKYNGCTIYYINNKFFIEIYTSNEILKLRGIQC